MSYIVECNILKHYEVSKILLRCMSELIEITTVALIEKIIDKYNHHFIFAANNFYSNGIPLQYKRIRICSLQLLRILQSKFYALKNYSMTCHHAISDEMKSQQVVFTRDCYFR